MADNFFSYLLSGQSLGGPGPFLQLLAYLVIGAGPEPFLFWGFLDVGQVRCRQL